MTPLFEQLPPALRELWSATPFMVDAFTGSVGKDRWCEMMQWCMTEFGLQCDNRWSSGGATINGWTWMGFDTQEALDKFVSRWGDAPVTE